MTDDTTTETAPTEPTEALAPAEQPTTDLATRRDEQKAQEAAEGVLHDTGLLDRSAEDYIGAPTLQSAGTKPAKGDTGIEAPEGTVIAKPPATMAEQKKPSLTGKHYQQGYVGEVASTEDLTLPAVLERDYPKEN